MLAIEHIKRSAFSFKTVFGGMFTMLVHMYNL